MARTDMEQLVYTMDVRIDGMSKQLDRALAKINGISGQVENRNRQMMRAIERDVTAAGPRMFAPLGEHLRREIGGLAAMAGGIFATQQVVEYADAWTRGRNALAAAGIATDDLIGLQQRLVDMANESRSSTDATVALFARLTRATEQLGLSQEDVLRLTELLNKSFSSSGLTTQEAASAALQLSQALASGSLQGDELRSIRENAPAVAKAIADAMGVGIGALKDLGAEGKITAGIITQAIFGASEDIESRFASTSMTIGQALTVLNNEMGRYIGEADAGMSATEKVAAAIVLLAENLDKIIPVVTTLATLIGAGYAASLTTAAVRSAMATASSLAYQVALIRLQARQTGATAAQIALNAAMAANPLGLVITVVAALAAGLLILARDYNTTAIAARELDEVVGAADTAINDYRDAVERAKNASAEEREELRKKAAALREVTLARINDARVAAQRQIDEAVAARRRADAALEDSAAARQRSFANPSNATAALSAGASSQARGAISLAVRAREEADTAIQAYERLKDAMHDVENPSADSGGGGGGGPEGDKGAAARNNIAELRLRLDLEERLALARSTGDKAAIRREEERQRLVELTEKYRQAGYDDAAQRALAMLAAENQAEMISEERERSEEARRDAAEQEAEARRRTLDWTERQLNAEIEIASLRGDDRRLRALEREAELRQRIADYMERYGIAGAGLALAEQLQVDRARADGDAEAAARGAARTFVDVISADDPWAAAGQAFRRAAWDGLEDTLTGLFKGFLSGGATGVGGFLRSLIPGFAGGVENFGGGLAYVHKGEVLTNLPKGANVIPANRVRMGAAIPTSGAIARASVTALTATIRIDLDGANGDEAIRRIAHQAAAEGSARAVAQATTLARRGLAADQQRLRRLGAPS